jgi:predicted ArsR family transcriptional regulator
MFMETGLARVGEWGRRFLSTTRGRIVSLLRGSSRTVNDLSEALDLTDNAVRAHLTTLERDGLVRQASLRRGVRRPHYSYELTAEAEALFPKAYEPVLALLLKVLEERLGPDQLEAVLIQTGREAARPYVVAEESGDFGARLEAVQRALGDLGGMAELVEEEGRFTLRGGSCPLAGVAAGNPAACRMVQALISEITNRPVQEHCERENGPTCCFELAKAPR